MLLILLGALAGAADVVWLAPPDPALAAPITARAGGSDLQPVDLLAAASDWGPRDEAALRRLEDTLRQVREYELRLDGELVIMADLAEPIEAIEVLRGESDRVALFAALAYQGFAVNRFFDEELATDDRAAPYRVEHDGVFLEAPWAHAAALDPERAVSAYDIAEAPQRLAYGQVQARVQRLLPARVVPRDLPPGTQLVINGRPVVPDGAGRIPVVPGRTFVHLEQDGRILARWRLDLDPGERAEVRLPPVQAAFESWVAALRAGEATAPPEALHPAIEHLGGEVWLVDPTAGPSGWRVTPTEVSPLVLREQPEHARTGLGLVVSAGGGWLSSGDFYLQDPERVPRTRAAVNAPAVALSLSLDLDRGPLRLGAGVGLLATPFGEHHRAGFGDRHTRLRPYPHLAVGHPLAQATVGFAFPHHPTAGLRTSVPLGASLELAGGAWYGLAPKGTRDDGTPWAGQPLYAAFSGVAWRFGL